MVTLKARFKKVASWISAIVRFSPAKYLWWVSLSFKILKTLKVSYLAALRTSLSAGLKPKIA